MKLVIILAPFLIPLVFVFFQVEGLTCYNCGYREDADGIRTQIPNNTYEDGVIYFCGLNYLNDSITIPTEEAPAVRIQCLRIILYPVKKL